MSFLTRIMRGVMFERPARKNQYEDYARLLSEKGKLVEERIALARGIEKQHRVLTHLIGIEKWAQRRVRVALGEPFLEDEYDLYRPPFETTWGDLLLIFHDTRAETIGLVERLSAENVPYETYVAHNQFGDLSVRGWLQYMLSHADIESKRLTKNR